jgi:acetyl esterase/lipase
VALVWLLVAAGCAGGGDGGGRDAGGAGVADRAPGTQTRPEPTRSEPVACPARPGRDVPYVRDGHALQRLDVYPPARGCPAPVVVWVHGGGWMVGDKRNLGRKATWFPARGYVLVSVNYRLTDLRAAEPLRWPAHNEDVAAAIAWVRREIHRFGGDAGRIALLGHSAGAGIAAAVATDPRLLGAHGLDLDTLDCVAPLDTEGFDVAAAARRPGRLGQIYRAAFGTDPDTWREASPITHVRAGVGIPPTFLVRRGGQPRQRMVDRYAEALREAEVEVTVLELTHFSHADVNRRIGEPGEAELTPALERFLAGCLGR